MRAATRFRSWLPVAFAAAGLGALALMALPFAVDDAFIVFRYGENLASGRGWAFNPGTPATDGVTGPLWIVPALVAHTIGVSPLSLARVVGLGSALGAAALVVTRLRRRALGRRAAWIPALLLAASPQLAIWSVAGLSTGAATLLATGAALATTARPAPRPWLAGLCIAALAWSRPEMALFALVLLAGLAARDRRAAGVALAVSGAGALGLVAFRLWLFGDPLPLSFHAKPADLSVGLGYAFRGALVLSGIGGAGLAILAAIFGRRDDRLIGLALLAHLVAITVAGGDWMPGFRLHAPIVPLYALLVGALFTRKPPDDLGPRVLLVAAALMALVVPALDAWVQLPRAREAGVIRQRDGSALADYLAARGDSVALLDIGYLGYASGLEVVDLGGVTDPVVAHARGGHGDKLVDVGYLAARDPDLVVLSSRQEPFIDGNDWVHLRGAFPIEHRVAATDWLRNAYRIARVVPYGDSHYVVLARE